MLRSYYGILSKVGLGSRPLPILPPIEAPAARLEMPAVKAEQVEAPSSCCEAAAENDISAFYCGTASGEISNGRRLAMPLPWLLALFC